MHTYYIVWYKIFTNNWLNNISTFRNLQEWVHGIRWSSRCYRLFWDGLLFVFGLSAFIRKSCWITKEKGDHLIVYNHVLRFVLNEWFGLFDLWLFTMSFMNWWSDIACSVVGLNFDFVVLNLTKHTSYLIYNASMFFSSVVQRQYHKKYGFNQVLLFVPIMIPCLVVTFMLVSDFWTNVTE